MSPDELIALIQSNLGAYISKHYGECCESAVDAFRALRAVAEIIVEPDGQLLVSKALLKQAIEKELSNG